MRKVTERITKAFLQGQELSVSNSWTDGNVLRLFGNLIAYKTEDGIVVTLAGHQTVTTMERLRGLLATMGHGWTADRTHEGPVLTVWVRNFQAYIGDKKGGGLEISSTDKVLVRFPSEATGNDAVSILEDCNR